MSWALEEWKEGLSTRALQKIQELEGQLDKLKKERQQRQFQLESLEAALQKQKQKVAEDQKNEGASLKRENQSLMETCDNLVKMKQKISHELQVKESQVNFQEGQLNSSKKQIEKLEQELKRFFKVFSHFIIFSQKASKPVPPSTLSHREIARHQASSSVFSWQQEKTPTHHSASAQETPHKRGFTALQIPWEQETPPNRKSSWQTERKDTSYSFHENQSNLNLLDQLKAQNQELKCKVNELDHQLQAQEHDIKGYMNKLQETQLQLEKTKLELTEKDKVLNKSGDEVMRLTSQLDRVTAKCTKLEQKLKKMSEDLNCQRQNAESTRCSLEQKIKDKDKDYQEELSHQQRTLQMLDQENTQIKTKLNQELQQARSTQNILQAELDKVIVMKQQLEKNSDEFKQKLCRTEQALQTSQTKENDLRRSMEEMMQEKQLLSHQLDKKSREVNQLEEELKKMKHCLKQSQNLAEEMKDKNATQEGVLKALQEKINQQEKSSVLELAVADLEKQRDCSQDLLKKREHHIEQLNDKLLNTQRELEGLLNTLGLKEKECEELKKETILFSQWKNEKEQLLNQLLLEKEGLQSTISNLEICLKTQHVKSHDVNESFKIMETENEKLGLEIKNLQNAIEGKNIELEAQKQAYEELQQKAEYSDQKYKKEVENLSLKIVQLTTEVEHLKQKLQLLSSEIIGKDQRYEELHIQYEKISSLVKSENSSQMMNEDYCGRDLLILEQPVLNNSISNILEIQGSLPLEQGDKRTKLHSEDQSMENVAKLQHKVSSSECNIHIINFVTETNLFIDETLIALENKDKQLQKLSEQLEYGEAEIKDLKTKNQLLEESVKKLSSEIKEINSILLQNKKEIEELIHENGNLKEINAILNIEKMNLIQKNVSFSNCFIEREKTISELSDRSKEEELLLLKRCEEAEKGLEILKEKYKLMEEKNIELECILKEHTITSLCGKGNNELKELEEAFAREHKDYMSKLALAEEKNEKLIFEMETMQCRLRAEVVAIQNSSKIEADGLRQEISNFKDEQNKMQEQHHFLLQENDRLMKLVKGKNVQMNELVLTSSPASEQISESVNELDNLEVTQIEMLHLNLEAKDSSLNTHNAQVISLEQVIEHMELRLKESEKEKEVLQQELEMIKKELKIRDSSDQSFETSNYEHCKREMDEKYISVLHELSTSQNDNAQLMTSLQTTVNKLNELEKMCEILQTEKLELTSELNDSKSECILATTKMAEKVEKLVNEVKTLNNKNSDLSGELIKENGKDEFREQFDQPKSICLELIEGRIEGGNDYEHLKLSNKEVQMHFIELQEKFSSLQIEHRILHEQHCHMSSKLSELCSYTDTLKAENSVLSVNLKNIQTDLMKQLTPGKEEIVAEEGESLSSCMNEIANLTSFVESSFYKDLFEETREIPSLNSLEENLLDNQSSANIDESPCSSLDAGFMTKNTRSGPNLNIEEFETLCQSYQISIKNLEDKYENQKIMKDKEIQELKELICSERNELEFLRKQYLSEIEQWQEKLANVTMEMESKLAAEKKQSEYLSLQLEVAGLQLQDLELSSRSFLIAEGEDVSMLCLFSPSICCSNEKSYVNELTPCNLQDTFNSECEEIAEIEGISSVAVYSREVNLENEHRRSSDKTHSECIPESSFSSNDTLAAMDFLENQVLIQNLQFKVKETSNENLKLIHGIEERDKKVDRLLSEIKELDYKVDLQKAELTAKICMCSELEKVIQELQKEKSDLNEKLRFLSYDNQKLLQRVKSEKTSIENHAFSLEADLESLQTKNLCLEKDNENKQKVISNLEEQLSLIISERNQLNGELDILLKSKLKMEEICDELKERVKVLESSQRKSLQHIQVVESEVRDKTQLLQTMSSDVNQLLKDKDYLQEQLQNLEKDAQMLSLIKDGLKNEISQLTDEKELFLRQSENQQAKLNDVEAENVNLSKALEGSLIEKGEIAARLNSTQEEVHQLKNGIEKLKVRIEADEKKKHHVLEKLKESERKADSFKDKIEALERELLMSEENQEAIILDAENAKSELETLKTQMEELTKGLKRNLQCLETELVSLRSEKDNMSKELQEKQSQVCELEELTRSLNSLESEVASLRKEKENILKDLQEKQAQNCELEEVTRNLQCLETELVSLRSEKDHMSKVLEEKQSQVCELEELTKKKLSRNLKSLETEFASLTSEKENMLKQLCESEKLTKNLKCLETELVSLSSEKQNVLKELQEKQAQVEELKMLNVSFESLLEKKEEEKRKLKEESQHTTELLQKQLNDLNEKIDSFQEEHNIHKASEQDLNCQVDCLKHEKIHLLQQLEETKNNNAMLKSSVNDFIQEIENNKQKLEKTTEENGILQKQVQDLGKLTSMLTQMEAEQQLWEKEKSQLEHLTVELQQKIQELSKNETLYNSLEALQNSYANLENELNLTKKENSSLLEKVNYEKITNNEALLQHEINEMMQKMTVLQEEYNGEKNRFTDYIKIKEVENVKYVTQLKKENENARGKIQLLIKNCKQLENEKEALQKEINGLETLQENQKQSSTMGVNVEELMAEVKELKEAIEGKNKETDEYLDKYCNLLVSYEKMEKAKNMLESQVTLLNSLQGKIASQSSPMLSSDDSMHCSSQPVTENKTLASHGKVPSKRPRSRIAKESDGDALPSTPETFIKKIKKEVTPKGITYSLRGLENTQYEPEGLPEVVKKGFADIPTEKTSPYILRRTTMATKTRTSPRLAAQKLSPPDLQKKESKNLAETFKPAAGGSKSQMVNNYCVQGALVHTIFSQLPKD
uniref:Centromere protein F n=1 Tax=Monodelphis domestica TaxID=13616 RepID=F7EG17_MONDO